MARLHSSDFLHLLLFTKTARSATVLIAKKLMLEWLDDSALCGHVASDSLTFN